MLQNVRYGALDIRTGGLCASTDYVHKSLCDCSGAGAMVGYLNPHLYNWACRDRDVYTFLSRSDLVCIDGVGTLVAGRMVCGTSLQRVVATALFESILDSLDCDREAVLIGTTESEVAAAAQAINARSKGLQVVAAMDGYGTLAQYREFLGAHHDVEAVLVGAGTPYSAQICLLARALCRHAVCWSIGAGTIKIYAGSKTRAPAWLADFGCEWIHRSLFEPHVRRRIIPGIPRFALNLMLSSRQKNRREIQR